jgi:hypothetical protein
VGSVRVRGPGLEAQVAGGDSLHRIADSCGDEAGLAAHLDSAVRQGMLADHDARPWIPAQMRHLHVAAARDDAETALSPFVPDRRQQHRAVIAAVPVMDSLRSETTTNGRFSDRPVLLRLESTGHLTGSLDQAIEETTDWHAFLFDQLGLGYRPVAP